MQFVHFATENLPFTVSYSSSSHSCLSDKQAATAAFFFCIKKVYKQDYHTNYDRAETEENSHVILRAQVMQPKRRTCGRALFFSDTQNKTHIARYDHL